MVISTCFQLYVIYLAITQLPPITGLNFSHLFFIFPPEQLDSLRQIFHLKGQWTIGHANPPLLNHRPNIQRVFLGQVAPWSQICQRWEHPAPTYSQAHSCCPGFPVKKFPREIDQQLKSNISRDVKLWSSGNISWRLVRTCHPSEQKHSPCLYTALSTTIHSPWPCNMTKVPLTIPHRRWRNLGGSTLLQSSSDSQLVLYWHRSPTHPGWQVQVLPSLTPWSPHTLLGFDILSSFF